MTTNDSTAANWSEEGARCFALGMERIVPRSILVDHGVDSAREWYRGWDAANLAAPLPDEEETSRKIDMDNVARLVRQAGVACIVEQTGGGTATLFAGVRTGYEYQAAAGPGHFQDFRNGYFADPWAYDSEFYVSKDDQGESGDYIDCEGLNDEQIAAHILAIVRS